MSDGSDKVKQTRPWVRGRPDMRLEREVATLRGQLHADRDGDLTDKLNAVNLNHVDDGFAIVRAAERDLVRRAGPSELLSKVREVWFEGVHKLAGWRLEAFQQQLGKLEGGKWSLVEEPLDVAAVVQALDILRSWQGKGWDNLKQRNWLLSVQAAVGTVALFMCVRALVVGCPYSVSDEAFVPKADAVAPSDAVDDVAEADTQPDPVPADVLAPASDPDHPDVDPTPVTPEPTLIDPLPTPGPKPGTGPSTPPAGAGTSNRAVAAVHADSRSNQCPSGSPPVPWLVLYGVVSFGLLGAVISGTHTTISRLTQHQPAASELLAETSGALARLALGPMSALILFVVLHTPVGIAVYEVNNLWGLYVVCFVAGFSEKLVVRAVEAVEDRAGATSNPK